MTNAEANTAATVAEQGAHVAPETAPSQKRVPPRRRARPRAAKQPRAANPKGDAPKKQAKAGKKAAKSAKAAGAPRAESKGAKILEMIGRPKGATLAEIMKATDWQAHRVRGFISTATKKHNLKIESTKTEAGVRVYKIAK